MQEHLFDDPLKRVIDCVQINLWGEIDLDITFDYEPLRELSDAELAEARKQEADTHAVYVNAGVIAPEEVRQTLAEDEGSPYAGVDLSGPPPEPPMMEPDPLGGGGAPDAPGGAPPASATRASYAYGDAQDQPDLLAGITEAIKDRQDAMAYEHWWYGAQDAKQVSAASVDYGPGMPESHCGICRFFTAPHGCSRVIEPVDADGWCKLFSRGEG
jgi:hypothetical protein